MGTFYDNVSHVVLGRAEIVPGAAPVEIGGGTIIVSQALPPVYGPASPPELSYEQQVASLKAAAPGIEQNTALEFFGGEFTAAVTGAGFGIAAIGAGVAGVIATEGAYTPIVLQGAGLAAEAAETVDGAEAAADNIPANKLQHVFGDGTHQIDGLLNQFGGDQQAAYQAVQSAANAELAAGRLVAGPNGILPSAGNTLNINGTLVQLSGGRVISGRVAIGSFSGVIWLP